MFVTFFSLPTFFTANFHDVDLHISTNQFVLECFDTVWLGYVKIIPEMTYCVSGGTLNRTLSFYNKLQKKHRQTKGLTRQNKDLLYSVQ